MTKAIEIKTKKNKVCIVGFAPSYAETPWHEEDTEIWVLNEFYKLANKIPNFKADRWFEIHDLSSESKSNAEHQEFLQKVQHEIPLYVQKKYDHLPKAIAFPKDDIVNFFDEKGFSGAKYFTNSISWFIALAIFEGFKEISVYGVDMATDSEYGWQLPSCEYWIGIAEGMGIKITIPQASDILKCSQLYAFESNNKNRTWMKAQIGELTKRVNQFNMQEQQANSASLQAKIAQAEIRGAQSAYKEILKRTQ